MQRKDLASRGRGNGGEWAPCYFNRKHDMMGISGDISCDFLRGIANVLSIVYGVLIWFVGSREVEGLEEAEGGEKEGKEAERRVLGRQRCQPGGCLEFRRGFSVGR